MEYRIFGKTCVVRIDRGEEVMASLASLCRAEGIRLAAVQGLGASDRAVLCVYDVDKQVYHRQTLTGPMEIASITGTVTEKDGEPYLHLHAVLCDEQLHAHGGHVNEIHIYATCEIVLSLLDGAVGRKQDAVTGLNVFSFD